MKYIECKPKGRWSHQQQFVIHRQFQLDVINGTSVIRFSLLNSELFCSPLNTKTA